MEAKIIQEKQNHLFNRKEVILEIQGKIVPSHIEAEKIISEKFSTQAESFKIKKIDSSFGSRTFKILANIYHSKKEKDAIEFKSKKEREAEKKIIEEQIAEKIKEKEAKSKEEIAIKEEKAE